MNNQVAAMEVQHLVKSYSQGDLNVDVLKEVSFRLEKGERVAIVGSSGSGKSTLLHCLGGLDAPTRGKIFWNGTDITSVSRSSLGLLRNKNLGFVYQFHHLLAEFSALENVAIPLVIGGMSVATANRKATEMLERVGLGYRLKHKPGELSGGERQRAAVARALVTHPACVLADEPTGNLDHDTALEVFELMQEVNREIGTSLIMVTHDKELAASMDKIWTLRSGVLYLDQESLAEAG